MNGFKKSGFDYCRRFLLLICWMTSSSFQGDQAMDEYAVKGMFLYNFTKYIDWSNTRSGNNFVIAVYGKSDITRNLQQIAGSKKINNKKMEVLVISSLEEAGNCQIIFIPASNNRALKETIEKMGSKGILIVTEDEDMALKGSCINLVNVEGKMKFEMNVTAVKRAGLKISSQLEALAIIIK